MSEHAELDHTIAELRKAARTASTLREEIYARLAAGVPPHARKPLLAAYGQADRLAKYAEQSAREVEQAMGR